MAVSSGAGPHFAWLEVNGQKFPLERGSVNQQAQRKSSSFSGLIPMSYPGAMAALANLGDNEASISASTRGVEAKLVTGELDDVNFDFLGRTIQFTGRDKSAKLHEKKTSEKWLNKKPSEIVKDLAGRVGLSGDIADSALLAGKKLEQDFASLSDNISFAQAIHQLALLDGARWWFDANGKFHYQPLGNPQGIYTITINQQSEPISADCIELRVRRNIQAGKTIKTTVKSWHPKKKQIFSYSSNVEGVGGPKEYSYDIPGHLQEHVTKHAKSHGAEKARHELMVTATVIGDPTVSAGMGLQLSGTNYFDQTFEIDSVQHEIGMPGHRTHITARSAKKGRKPS